MLTSLPNLVIIPFILLSGKLAKGNKKMFVLATGLVIFTIAGILYFFADSMIELILLGCLVGVGCGFVIPLAASLLAIYFYGRRRVWALGMKSGVSNAAVIVATLFVGWVAAYNWHLSFIVYLTPVLPFLLIPFMRGKFITSHFVPDPQVEQFRKQKDADNIAAQTKHPGYPLPAPAHKKVIGLLLSVILLYVICTYATTAVSYCIPFTMGHYGFDSGVVGIVTAMFFLSATVAGFTLPIAIKTLGSVTIPVSIAVSATGLLLTALFHSLPLYITGVFLIGYGYGIVQPIIYDKTTAIAPNKSLANQYFSYVLTGNYIAISVVPFFIKLMASIFHTTTEASPNFAFILNAVILGILFVVSIVMRKAYVFHTDPVSFKARHARHSAAVSDKS
ncbi:MAG: MFS transporter, partial [Muribaculaceae bacterium]|nr:MFS transporter [Muribaculaceae bacterium]